MKLEEDEIVTTGDVNGANVDDQTLGDPYDYQTDEALLMDDEIDSAEAGFMRGYESAVYSERESKKKRTAT